jgi:hypothetical protein
LTVHPINVASVKNTQSPHALLRHHRKAIKP